ncbi:MAG: serine/threonine-protein kinase, partial [Planctomycetota bacterium]
MDEKKKKQRLVLALLLGVHNRMFSYECALECALQWKENPDRPFLEIIESSGGVGAKTIQALETLLEDWIFRANGDLDRALESLPVERMQLDMVQAFLSGGVNEITLLEWEGKKGDDPKISWAIPGEGLVEEKEEAAPKAEPGLSLRESPPDRYVLREELGRGGLGRVVEAVDRDLEREVALKLMLPGKISDKAIQRFLFEARATGRLTHPNIVPLYGLGLLPQEKGKIPYFAMAKITGRDVHHILQGIRRGDAEIRKTFTQHRLLRVFQEVCHAMAFAHDHGVIHRDLKPGNIMVGEYGEVFVVDWGLAKFLPPPGQHEVDAPPPEAEEAEGPPLRWERDLKESTHPTVEGKILGTPAYMPPEQADGRVSEVDERSDIYALGAILFEILSLAPPHEGEGIHTVIAKVIEGEFEKPSARAVRWPEGMGPSPVSPALDEICLKALSREKAERYASAKELAEEIETFLEGEKERERNRRRAEAKIAEGLALLEELRGLRARIQTDELQLRRDARELAEWQGPEERADYWRRLDELQKAREDQARKFALAGRAFQTALEFERNAPKARAALAGMYWEQFLVEEDMGNRREMIVMEALVREFNDGQYDDRLAGKGTLAVSTRAYPCACLREGRRVEPEWLSIQGIPPSPDGGESGGEVPGKLEVWKVHGPDCSTEAIAGVDIWLFRMVSRHKLRIPARPQVLEGGTNDASLSPGLPSDAVLDRLYGRNSPFRPTEGLYLGKTPVPKITLPMGSYLLILAREGFLPVRVPVRVGRLQHRVETVTLYGEGEVPEGFIQIPGGNFTAQGDRTNPYSNPRIVLRTEDTFLARFPVTCAEYLEFLNALVRYAPQEAIRCAPRRTPSGGGYWPRDPEGFFQLPTEGLMAGSTEAWTAEAGKLEMTEFWWEGAWPVFGVSWEDL